MHVVFAVCRAHDTAEKGTARNPPLSAGACSVSVRPWFLLPRCLHEAGTRRPIDPLTCDLPTPVILTPYSEPARELDSTEQASSSKTI